MVLEFLLLEINYITSIQRKFPEDKRFYTRSFIVIHFLSSSHLLDHSSSDGSKRHIVASAISTSNGIKKNGVSALRCYVCGGNTGLPCEDIRSAGRRSPYVRPKPQTTLDGRKMFENCTDLINNKGCIKQVINGGKYTNDHLYQMT